MSVAVFNAIISDLISDFQYFVARGSHIQCNVCEARQYVLIQV